MSVSSIESLHMSTIFKMKTGGGMDADKKLRMRLEQKDFSPLYMQLVHHSELM